LPSKRPAIFGDGHAALRIAEVVTSFLGARFSAGGGAAALAAGSSVEVAA
jgi:hypothetical protein